MMFMIFPSIPMNSILNSGRLGGLAMLSHFGSGQDHDIETIRRVGKPSFEAMVRGKISSEKAMLGGNVMINYGWNIGMR